MLIIENPLRLLIIALAIMICLLLFFKIVDFFDKVRSKSKSDKKADVSSDNKAIEKKADVKSEESAISGDVPFDSKNMTNYLYDRFVLNPTLDDLTHYENNISNAFITDEKYSEIRDKKVKIEVKPVENSVYAKNQIHSKIAELTNNNRSEKERMLNEFNNLSKEMKLLLIENIMQKID